MLYYGDRSRGIVPRRALEEVASRLAAAGRASGLVRHEALVAALVEAGELAQGLADALFRERGHDDDHRWTAGSMDLAVAIARAVWASWRGSPDLAGLLSAAVHAVEAAAALDLPGAVRARVAEGFAHYALYPEAYGVAAAALDGAAPVVIGIRSIGTSLAAMVAAAARADTPVTVRPAGHPYRRTLDVRGALAGRLLAAARSGRTFAVVDEGPGMSGSSFEAAAGWLEAAGAPPPRIVLFPSHAGPPGPAADGAARARFARAERRVATFEEVALPRLASWVEPLTGPAPALEDVSAGRWRRRAGVALARWPPVFAWAERRKLLVRGREGPLLLLRFGGLGRYGEESAARARALAEAGWAPPVVGAAHGFLAQPWTGGGPLVPGAVPRDRLLAHLAGYLAFRARAFPAAAAEGTPAAGLLEAVRVNAAEALGPAAADAARGLDDAVAEVDALPRVGVDGKLEGWEWTVSAGGRLVKHDAVDHAWGHDLAGTQPLAWDAVAAGVELDLSPEEVEDLAARAAGTGSARASRRALRLLEAAYLAHRLGRWSFAREAEADLDERARIERALRGYRERLRARLERVGAW